MTDKELAAEIVKLKQEVAKLRIAIDRIDAALSDLLNDHDGNYSPTLRPLDTSAPDAFLTARTDWQT